MPVRAECCTAGSACPSPACLHPPAPVNTHQPGVATSLLYSGSQFRGYQRSKGNSYDVEVVLQHVTIENSYLCGYLKIKGLTEVSQPLHQVRCSKEKFDPFSEGTCWKQAESGTCRFETNLRLSRPAPPL
ncbi:Glucose-induced degradation-like protein 4 [Oryzias melastigma]|uniref:Glucose-induced degradation-like protein 4 n=1 Tax=Oryzias melastigma TaxID=30732 RepID=A0A834BPF7_ORYME|nr:Glucose-induced degradation-like protein 4 [Oryzias melastigma]